MVSKTLHKVQFTRETAQQQISSAASQLKVTQQNFDLSCSFFLEKFL
jgi:hypothetical protein